MARRLLILGLIGVAILVGGFVAVVASVPNYTPEVTTATDGGGINEALTAKGWVVVSIVRDGQQIYHYESHNLITNAGKDFISAQVGSTSPGTNGANYIALSSTADANPNSIQATDTTLVNEITTNGLSRAQGTYSHTAGTNTFTVTKQFTATGTVNNVQRTGLFTALSGGTMMAENSFSAANLIANDQITVTWTITIG